MDALLLLQHKVSLCTKFIFICFLDDIKISSSHCTSLSELHFKTVGSAFWNHQVEEELRESGWEKYLFANRGSREECMMRNDVEWANLSIHMMRMNVCKNANNEVNLHYPSYDCESFF